MKKLLLLVIALVLINSIFAQPQNIKKGYPALKVAAEPTSCITSLFSKTGDIHWSNISLKLTNNCGRNVDVQNASVTFKNSVNLNTNFWGNFGSISYPDNPLLISSQVSPGGGYIASFFFHIPEQPWANSILKDKESITISYGAETAGYDASSVNVYLSGPPVQSGDIVINNSTIKPSTITQNYALVDIIFNGQKINTAQVPWSGSATIANLTPGAYTLQPQTLTDSAGNTFQGLAQPNSVTVVASQKVTSTVTYQQIIKFGQINIVAPALPSALVGYTNTPTVILTRSDTGATVTQNIPWNATTTISKLENNITYQFSTPKIVFNSNNCIGSFNPTSLASSSAPVIPSTKLTYVCSPVAQDAVKINVSGLPCEVNSITVTFQPTDGSAPVTKNVAIKNGVGTDTINLTDGVVYSVSSTSVTAYSVLFNPQPLMVKPNVTESIGYVPQAEGKIIAYVPGWKTPPSAPLLANAGYTHVLVAFGVFSTSKPGEIVPAFETITPAYVAALHQAGIKVSLSLGGALTSLPNTSVDFHQVLAMATSPTAFQQTFITSVENLITQYDFDGIDIDIEHGLTGTGSFSSPTGDIAVLANIINTLHQKHPNYLISLAPQVANIAATSGYDQTWGNYAALIMQTHQSLSWVGIQLYNTGCAYGIDQICYADLPTSPDLSVAMATDLLENWPDKDKTGRPTGFQPYISYLDPSQVVLGYPAPNNQGISDGSPVKPTSVIKRAIQCLRTGSFAANGCDNYLPPRVYPNIGGVFEWEATYDQSNNFKFATDLQSCVMSGSC